MDQGEKRVFKPRRVLASKLKRLCDIVSCTERCASRACVSPRTHHMRCFNWLTEQVYEGQGWEQNLALRVTRRRETQQWSNSLIKELQRRRSESVQPSAPDCVERLRWFWNVVCSDGEEGNLRHATATPTRIMVISWRADVALPANSICERVTLRSVKLWPPTAAAFSPTPAAKVAVAIHLHVQQRTHGRRFTTILRERGNGKGDPTPAATSCGKETEREEEVSEEQASEKDKKSEDEDREKTWQAKQRWCEWW